MEHKKDSSKKEEFSIQKLFSNPKFLYSLAILFSFVLVIFCVDSYNAIQEEKRLESFKVDLPNVTQENSMTADEFRIHIIKLGIKQDLDNGVTPEAEIIKLKLFGIIR